MGVDVAHPDPHPRLRLLPTPTIPPIYVTVPPPKSYKREREKCPPSSISQPSIVPSIPRPKEEKEYVGINNSYIYFSLNCINSLNLLFR